MALTDIDITNRALTRIGAPTITSFDDGSREAEVMTQLYDHTFDTLITEAKWNFAVKDVELSSDVTTPTDPNFDYQYLVPSDYVQLVCVLSTSGMPIRDYTRQGDYILTNYNRVFAKYLYKPSETELPAWFINYLVVTLAHDSVENLVGVWRVQDSLAQQWQYARQTAYRMDNIENPAKDALAPSRYVSVRHS